MRLPKFNALNSIALALSLAAVAAIGIANVQHQSANTLINASYDPTRELYISVNSAFAYSYKKHQSREIAINQFHGGSSSQAKQVASGEIPADVVTLGLPSDIDVLRKRGLIAENWQQRLPNQSHPYYSTIVFVVRKNNPLAIHDWPDLIKTDVDIITPDPKTSGNGKLTALAAWGSVIVRGGNESQARDFLKAIYTHAPFLLPAARSAGLAFTQEKLGDVHVAWENEAIKEVRESKQELQIVYPPISILAEPSVAWIDGNVQKNGHTDLAREYLEFLFSDEAQELIAENGYRPYKPEILSRHSDRLPEINLFPITAIAANWDDAQSRFFADNGIIDSVYTPKPR
jgi:sulfate/thiosulfate transport system substrate-binding protein